MASPASEASEIRRRGRQRLIGAVALVLLLVVFVPMLLDKEPGRSQPVPPIPPRDNAPALPVAPVKAGAQAAPKDTPPEAATGPAPAPAKSPAPDSRLSKGMPPVAAVASVKPTAPTPSQVATQSAPPKLEGFAVQVGAFRDEAKLSQAREKLAAAKVVHFTERLDSQGGPLTRLRAGPYPTREAAESAQATIKRAGLEGKVVPLP